MDSSAKRIVEGCVALDGARYENCRFLNTDLVYSGGAPPELIDCDFQSVRLHLEGPAHATLTVLRAFAAAGPEFRTSVAALLPELKG